MSLSFTVTTFSTMACNYAGLSSELNVLRQALDFDAGGPIAAQYRCRSPGVGGNWLIRDSFVARHIRLLVRYMNATAVDADFMYQADCAAFLEGPASIAALGFTYGACNLDMAGVRRSKPIKATGRHADQCYFDVVLPFIQDNPT